MAPHSVVLLQATAAMRGATLGNIEHVGSRHTCEFTALCGHASYGHACKEVSGSKEEVPVMAPHPVVLLQVTAAMRGATPEHVMVAIMK